MASTFSDLKIQLMATGENSGTWGDVTNVNLGTAIEEAITGSANIAFSSADVTLALTNTNETQTARNLRLNLTGTSGGNRNLIVPAIEKVYIINNGLANQVTVKNATGTGIAVPAGKTMYVYNDGTNVVDAITHLTSLTLATPLPVASGGTGSATAAFSGANITNLNASNVSSGTLNNARTTGAVANTANALVLRDASGNFSAGTVTAALSGNAATATALQTARTLTVGSTGKTFNGTANVAWNLAEIGVNNATLTMATSGIATGSQSFSSNQGTNATFTVNVPGTNIAQGTRTTTAVPITSSTGTNATLSAASTTLAGVMSSADKTKLDGIAAGAQVNVGTNLSWTNGTTAGPQVNSSTGSNAVMPTASATISGAVTTGTQTFTGTKSFSGAVILGQAGTATNRAVRADRAISTGSGIVGGGNLTANRTHSVSFVANQPQVKIALNANNNPPIFATRAWVNFNGTGTVSIRSSGNVSSITDLGVGIYRVNFATAMPDANYSASVNIMRFSTGSMGDISQIQANGMLNTSCQVRVSTTASNFDAVVVAVAIFR